MDTQEEKLNIITMPAVFEQKLFERKEIGSFLEDLFKDTNETAKSFLKNIKEKAAELSDDYEDTEWALAKEIDPDHHTFFVFPSDDSKQYTIDLPELDHPSIDFDYSDNLTRIVDNKLFGMIVFLSLCRDWWGDDDELDNMYMDLGQDLNASIVYAHKDICDEGLVSSGPTSEYGQMVSVVKEYLSPRHPKMEDHYDDYGLDDDIYSFYTE